MDTYPEMNWSEVARQAFIQKLRDLEFLRRFKLDSNLTKEDALRISAELNRELAKKYTKKD
jgi:hypothetical protein